MTYRFWTEQPGERRCVNCDQRLVASSEPFAGRTQSSLPDPPPAILNYVCPDDHERWAYDSQSREWRQMY
jgi:hypothetical protein